MNVKLSDVKEAEKRWQRAMMASINPDLDMAVDRAYQAYRDLKDQWEDQKRNKVKSMEAEQIEKPAPGKTEKKRLGEELAELMVAGMSVSDEEKDRIDQEDFQKSLQVQPSKFMTGEGEAAAPVQKPTVKPSPFRG